MNNRLFTVLLMVVLFSVGCTKPTLNNTTWRSKAYENDKLVMTKDLIFDNDSCLLIINDILNSRIDSIADSYILKDGIVTLNTQGIQARINNDSLVLITDKSDIDQYVTFIKE